MDVLTDFKLYYEAPAACKNKHKNNSTSKIFGGRAKSNKKGKR